jgi:hypothetical protein
MCTVDAIYNAAPESDVSAKEDFDHVELGACRSTSRKTVKRQCVPATKLGEESEAHLGFVNTDDRHDRYDVVRAQI